MSSEKPKTETALTIVGTTPAKVNAVHFLKSTGKELSRRVKLIERADFDGAFQALVVGVLCWQAKGQTKHGEFQKWIGTHVNDRGYRSCAYFMKLALTFAETERLKADDIVALLKMKKAPKATADKKGLAGKIHNFIGDLSSHELLIKHEIKDVGLKAELTDGNRRQARLSADEQAQMELELIWSQAYEPAREIATLLEEKAAMLKPDQRAALEIELKKALQAVRAA